MIAMGHGIHFCPHCRWPLTPAEIKRGINFECPSCGSLLCFDLGPAEKFIRPAIIVAVTFFYAWRHGWDGGFVIFLLGFYSWAGLFVYFFFIQLILPGRLRLITPPVSKRYLQVQPLSEQAYESRAHSLRAMDLTGTPPSEQTEQKS
jgi:hypothetical protein